MALVVGDNFNSSGSLNTVWTRKLNNSRDTSQPFRPAETHPTQEYVVPRSRQGVSCPARYARCTRRVHTNTDDGSVLGLLVLIGVDGNGTQENESQNGEEDERH